MHLHGTAFSSPRRRILFHIIFLHDLLGLKHEAEVFFHDTPFSSPFSYGYSFVMERESLLEINRTNNCSPTPYCGFRDYVSYTAMKSPTFYS